MATWFTADLHVGHRNIIDHEVAAVIDAGPRDLAVHDEVLRAR